MFLVVFLRVFLGTIFLQDMNIIKSGPEPYDF